ncbi:MAG: type II secretion system protein GspD [Candidatus Omnitrophica bacterium]|nr:type II secretion system protein GspD [Candidatus Omnitrophota bacterium]
MKKFLATIAIVNGLCGAGSVWGAPASGQPVSPSHIEILDIRSLGVHDVLKLLSKKSGRNIIASREVQGEVNIYLTDVDAMQALSMIVDTNGWAYATEEDVVKVMTKQEFANKFGYPYGPETVLKVRSVEFMNLDELVKILEKVKTESGKIMPSESSRSLILMDTPDAVASMEEIIRGVDKPPATEVFELAYADADKILSEISQVLTPEFGTIRKDTRSNTLVVSDMPAKIAEAGRIIAAFDKKDREVLVEAKIVQVNLGDEFKLGVDWTGLVQDLHDLTVSGDFDVIKSNDKSGRLRIGTLSSDEYEATVEALETIGDTRILSSPSIVALNNREAKILVGSTEPYVTTTTTTPSAGPTTSSESVEFIEVGVKLLVTPTIHKDDYVTLQIKPEVSSVTRSLITSNNNVIPVVETTEAETTVTVKDGVTIVIGGLIKEDTIHTKKQIPYLGDIPVIGRTFGSEETEETQNEIAIFLTPTIITGENTARTALSTNAPVSPAYNP